RPYEMKASRPDRKRGHEADVAPITAVVDLRAEHAGDAAAPAEEVEGDVARGGVARVTLRNETRDTHVTCARHARRGRRRVGIEQLSSRRDVGERGDVRGVVFVVGRLRRASRDEGREDD